MELGSLIDRAYEVALDPQQWGGYLAELERSFRVAVVHLFAESLADRSAYLSLDTGMDPQCKREYYQHYFFLDLGWIAKQRMPVGAVTASNQLLPDWQYERQEYYCDFGRRYGYFYQMGGTIERDPDSVALIGMVRARRQREFTARDLERMRRLLPHLRRTLQINRRLELQSLQQSTLLDLLAHLRIGVLLLADTGAVLYANPAAERVLQDCTVLRCTRNGLAAAHPRQNRALQQLIGDAARTGEGLGDHPGGALRLAAGDPTTALQLLVAPFSAARRELRVRRDVPRVIVFLSDVRAQPGISQQALSDLFELTAAEAEVAERVVAGQSLTEIARETARSIHTVRTQIQSCLEKTGAARQADLVRLVLNSPAALVATPADRRRPLLRQRRRRTRTVRSVPVA